jgi:hypothetical protein
VLRVTSYPLWARNDQDYRTGQPGTRGVMYIGIGTLVLILIIVIVVLALRRGV